VRRLLLAGAAAALLASGAHAAQVAPNLPSLSAWENAYLPTETGPNGVPFSDGAPPAASGACTVGTQLGGQFAGSFKTPSACSSATIIFTFTSPTVNGFSCRAADLTTSADTIKQTAYTTTTVTFTATTAANDLSVFSCDAF